jgi:glyoxylase-like metal-dependent hydrolase (beta-lactamase superfamily II)
MGNWPKKFFSALEKIHVEPQEISHCVISHSHMDHIGLIGDLRRKNPNINVVMHEITSEKMKWETNPDNHPKLKEEARLLTSRLQSFGLNREQGEKLIQYFLKWPKMKEYHKPDIIVQDGDNLSIGEESLKIIWTPGHALGHICIFEEKRGYLFAGDHILSRITPHIGNFIINESIRKKYSNFNFKNILHLYLNSLERIQKLEPTIIFPAHQEVIYNPSKRITAIKEHHQQRLQEISEAIKEKPKTPFEISKIHFGDLDDVNSFLALSEVLGHLIYLEDQGKIQRLKKNNRILFKS